MSNTTALPYDDSFYAAQLEQSLVAARAYAACLGKVYRPNSVLDVGCGRGAWLKAFGEAGAQRLTGLDGAWNKGAMIEPAISFYAQDLEALSRARWTGERYDLAMSLEVAEHLPPDTSAGFVDMLCAASDVVIFGAAIPYQSGTRHINLRTQSAWAKEFAVHGYSAWDLFRPDLWGNDSIPYWYQQNTFLYLRNEHVMAEKLLACGVSRIERFETMDVVHPQLLASVAEMPVLPSAKRLAKLVLPNALVAKLTR
jgi:SAM-dependent methyltransferase